MNNSFTARLKALLPSISVLCLLFLLTLGRTQAATTTFSTDSSWLVTNNYLPNWYLPSYVLTSAWVAPGGGKTTCNQVGVVGANKIWFPANTANQTSYFRKTFSISNSCELKSVTIEIAADDNYVLFVNGIAMATGGATAKTFSIPTSILKCDNVIAVQARDFNGTCWWMAAKVTINTTPITISASSNSSSANSICVGQTLNLFAGSLSGATYSWTGPSGFTSSLQNPVKPNVAMADTGMYTVVVTSGKCCRFVSKVQVNIKNCKECLDLIAKEVFCKNGIYYMNVCIKNNSLHVANFINLISTTPGISYSPNILNPSGGLLPGQTYCKTVMITGSGAVTGTTVCLKATLLEIKNCQPTWSCTSMDELCVKLPDCQPVPIPCDWTAAVKDTSLTVCKGTSTTLSAYTLPGIVGAIYAWTSSPVSTILNGNTATPTVTPSANPTIYSVTISVINSDGTICKKNATVKVFLKDCPPAINCDSVKVGFNPNNVTICLGDSVQLNPITNPVTGLTYLWIPSTGLSNAAIKNPWAKPTVTTTYNLIVGIAGTNCKKDASITVTVKQCTPTPTGQRKAAEEEEIDDIIIAPNPTQSTITVQIPDSMNWEKATLINAQGIILNEQNRINEAKSVKFDVQSHPSGMYIVRVKTDKGFVNKKVIKE